jgi:hypothetical protein
MLEWEPALRAYAEASPSSSACVPVAETACRKDQVQRRLPVPRAVAALALTALWYGPVRAEMSPEELAKLAQNPVGNVISLPFQNATDAHQWSPPFLPRYRTD